MRNTFPAKETTFISDKWKIKYKLNINISQKYPRRGVLENSCSKIYDQNPGKIPMKKLIFGKVEPATLLKKNFFIDAIQGF